MVKDGDVYSIKRMKNAKVGQYLYIKEHLPYFPSYFSYNLLVKANYLNLNLR